MNVASKRDFVNNVFNIQYLMEVCTFFLYEKYVLKFIVCTHNQRFKSRSETKIAAAT